MQRLVDAGELTEEEAEHSERRNIILQALGPDPQVKVDLTHQTLRRGDTLIICSRRAVGSGPARRVRRAVVARTPTSPPLRRAHRPRERARRPRQHHRSWRLISRATAFPRPSRGGRCRLPGVRPARTRVRADRRSLPPTVPAQVRDAAAQVHEDADVLRRPPRGAPADHGRCLPARRGARRLALTAPTEAPLGARLTWVGALSFASGLPYFFFNETVPVWLAQEGVSLAGDRARHRRVRAVGAQVSLGSPGRPDRQPPRLDPGVPGSARRSPRPFSPGPTLRNTRAQLGALLLLYVTLSATQDIAIDAYTIETTSRPRAGRRQLGADRRLPRRELRARARCWSGSRRARAGRRRSSPPRSHGRARRRRTGTALTPPRDPTRARRSPSRSRRCSNDPASPR